MGELGLDLGLLVSQAVNFLLLLLLLYRFLFKPVMGKLEERAARIKQGLEDAEESARIREQAEKEYQETLGRARQEAHEIIEQATRTAEQQRQEILAQARQEAHEIVIRARQQAEREIQKGRIALQQEIVNLSIETASRLIRESLDDQKHRQLVQEFLTELDQWE